MDNLTQPEIDETDRNKSKLDETDAQFCLYLVKYMAGYLRNPPLIDNEKIDDTRQVFFRQIKRHLDEKATK